MKRCRPTSTDNNRYQPDKKRTTTDHKPTTNRPQILILERLLEGEKALGDLMTVCDYKDRDSFRKSVLNEMLDSGLVAMTHPENPNHKKQRYVITEKGRKLLES